MDFPEIFTEDDRDAAVMHVEDVFTLEYIRRLERVAYAAFVFYVKSSNLSATLPGPHYDLATLPVEQAAEALYQELSTVNFMQ